MAENMREAARLEAFSDGVFAIAITLLALNIKIPPAENTPPGTLATVLLDQWPIYLAFINSFITILVMWANHHNLFNYISRVNHPFLLINGLLLLSITFLPIPTALVAEYRRHPDQPLAAVIYCLTFVFIALAFNGLRAYAERKQLMNLSGKQSVRSYVIGPLAYSVAAVFAVFSPLASLAICVAMAIFFGLPFPVRNRLLGG